MNIQISGKGKTIVFLHGYCESLDIWKAFDTTLHTEYQIVLIDLPGHGQSPLLTKDFSIDDIADQVQQELKDHGISEYFVIGHSLGGYISLALAELYPESLLGLGLFSSSTFADDEDKKKVRDKVKAYILEHGVASFMDSFISGLFAPENRSRLSDEIEEMRISASKTPPDSVIGYAMAMKNRPDRTAVLAKSEKPVFVIAGERDMAVKLETSQQMIDLIRRGEALVLKGAAHNGYLESKNESISFIKSFLNQYI
ncbi:alpha/beta hydrolase [Reichenbachiella agarivorans]|uniref:Alpha/beta hydrolase n=1 Tax=Reichenbachiella agarivorans TaxID=2979464 RepID=A0ABY6CZ78_9BACT|nr:alpha/beta hydrolase [Reichenbachiella agarivorans]UXP33540.1 alpha/beta hydrolase [Reichenbachiella agarivorans]